MQSIVDYIEKYAVSYEKKEITTFNKMEYTPVVGTVIGSVEVLYGSLKMALEIIKGVGNCFVKNNEYSFKKEFGVALGAFGRGLLLTILPIFGGLMAYGTDKNCVWAFNHNNAKALLNAENITEKDVDDAHDFAKKLPYMNNDELDQYVPHEDLSYRYSWAINRKALMGEIAGKYQSLGCNEKADRILEIVNKVFPETLARNAKREKANRIRQEMVQTIAKRRLEDEVKRQQEVAQRAAQLRAART